MRIRYVLSDRQPVRTVDVDADKRVADLLKLIQAQSRVDYAPRDGLKLYRAQKHGDSDAPWLQAGDSDHVALCSGDKDAQAAFFVEMARLEPNQRLGDVFDLSALMSDESIQLVVKVQDDDDLAKDVEAFRKTNLLRLILIVSAVTLFKYPPLVAQMALHGVEAASECHTHTQKCDPGLLGYVAISTLLFGAVLALILVLVMKILRAMYTQETPVLRSTENWILLLVILMSLMTMAEDTALGYSESTSSAIEVIRFVSALLSSQVAGCFIIAGFLLELSTANLGLAFFVLAISPYIGVASSALKNPFAA